VWPRSDPPSDVWIAAFWQRISPDPVEGSLLQPVTVTVPEAGFTGEAIAIAPPTASPLHGYVLAMRFERRNILAGDEPFHLVFMGGFAPKLSRATEPLSLLSLVYPAAAATHSFSVDLPTRRA
jgi:hypothetical protein